MYCGYYLEFWWKKVSKIGDSSKEQGIDGKKPDVVDNSDRGAVFDKAVPSHDAQFCGDDIK